MSHAELNSRYFKRLAKDLKKRTGKPLSMCHQEIARGLGYRDFFHYQTTMKKSGAYMTHAEYVEWKRVNK